MAGKCWLYSFLSRHPNLRLRTPESVSIGRAIGFNRAAVGKFFTLLTQVYNQHKFPPERIWNVDETGITTVPNKQSKVISMRGKRQIGALVSAERGTLVTAEICMSASVTYGEVRKWMRQHPGRPVTIYEVGELFGEAFIKSAVMLTAINGFRKSGIYPLNPEVFPEWMFAPSETPERELNIQEDVSTTPNLNKDLGKELDKDSTSTTKLTATQLLAPLPPPIDSPQPSCSRIDSPQPSCSRIDSPHPSCSSLNSHTANHTNISSSSKQATTKSDSLEATLPKPICDFSVSPKEVFPIPKATRKPSHDNRRRGKAAVITSSPYKSELEANFKKSSFVKKLKLNEPDRKGKNVVKKAAPKTKLVPKLKIADSDSSEEEDNNDDACLYCNELYSNSKAKEGWIKCVSCNEWAYEACSAYDDVL